MSELYNVYRTFMDWFDPYRDIESEPREPEAMLYDLEAIKEELSEDEDNAEALEELEKAIETFTNEGIVL